MKNDELSIRMKAYEAQETSRCFEQGLPVYARIDGRGFSKFTKMAKKPFDASISAAMLAASSALLSQTNAKIAYFQSDEISLVWDYSGQSMFFDGKIQKLTSVVSGIATAAFIRQLVNDPEWNSINPNWLDKLPHFDARVIQLPSRTEATNMLVWREKDARKNAISMVADTLFSHKSLQSKTGKEKLQMIEEAGVVFGDFPVGSRQGTFLRRVHHENPISEELRLTIPEKNRPEPGTLITRASIEAIDMPPFYLVTNREQVIFEDALPEQVST